MTPPCRPAEAKATTTTSTHGPRAAQAWRAQQSVIIDIDSDDEQQRQAPHHVASDDDDDDDEDLFVVGHPRTSPAAGPAPPSPPAIVPGPPPLPPQPLTIAAAPEPPPHSSPDAQPGTYRMETTTDDEAGRQQRPTQRRCPTDRPEGEPMAPTTPTQQKRGLTTADALPERTTSPQKQPQPGAAFTPDSADLHWDRMGGAPGHFASTGKA